MKKKDPLKDNRIFPEEMHEHKPKNKKENQKHENFSWFWFVTGSAIAIFAVWFGFVYQKNNQIPSVSPSEQKEQIAAFNDLQNSRDIVSPQMREERINQLFGNNK